MPSFVNAQTCETISPSRSEVRTNKSTVDWDEPFDMLIAAYVDEATFNRCKDNVISTRKAVFYVYPRLFTVIPLVPDATYINNPAQIFDIQASKIGNEFAFTMFKSGLTMRSLNTSSNPWVGVGSVTGNFTIAGYFKYTESARQGFFPLAQKNISYNYDTNNHPVTDNLPQVQASGTINIGQEGIVYDALQFNVGIGGTGLNSTTYKHFYRITFADGGWVATGAAGSSGGTGNTNSNSNSNSNSNTSTTSGSYNTSLVSMSGFSVGLNMSMKAPDGVSWGSTPTYINYSRLGNQFGSLATFAGGKHKLASLFVVGVEETKSKDKTVCGPLKFNPQQIGCSSSQTVKMPASPATSALEKTAKPFPLTGLASNLNTMGVKSVSGDAKLYKVLFYPTLDLDTSIWQQIFSAPTAIIDNINQLYGFSYSANPQNAYFEVYSSKAELDKHKNDPPPAGVAAYQDTVTTAETKSGGGLYSFILKVISFIVIGLITVIYKIFSFVLVPVLNALIRIHPYQDQFVNVIYPGWLIMRNLANIAFIVALLVMGLRVLFQIDDASKTRSFMIKLVLMALLVNFSLVVAQGIVAIADTVQSQFLPENTKVIEALAVKLMVEPINVFQGATKFADTELATADIFKPIMLLITSLAAFFAFVAVAGFIAVRTVALWVFYLTSPVAYFGRAVPGLEKYAGQWWSEFIKYVITVPVLVFFLNIAALMATTFSQQSGNAVNVEGDSSYLLGGVAAGVEGFAFTIITQAVVLIFIFMGMKFAMSSGTIGSKQIVDYAKKGFDWATQTAPKALGRGAAGAAGWAKDTAADAGARALSDKGKHGWASVLRGAARPIEAGKALKKGYFDKPKEIFNKRFAKDFENRANQLQPWGEDKLFPAKMAYWKLTGQNAKALQTEAERKKEKSSILTDDEKTNVRDKRRDDVAQLTTLMGGEMQTGEGRKYADQMRDQVDEQRTKVSALASLPATDPRRIAEQTKLASMEANHRSVDGAVSAAEAGGATQFNTAGLQGALSAVVDLPQLEQGLRDAIVAADTEIANDNALRAKHGVTTMTEKDREDLLTDAGKDVALAQKRERPASKDLDKEEAAEVLKQKKEITDLDLDYDQMKMGTLDALKKNNMVQAKAYFKVMAENGLMKKFLEEQKVGGKDVPYNVEGLQKFIQANVKGTNKQQIALIREISNSAAKNGNMPLGFAVKNLAGGGGMLKTYQTQMKEVAKEMQKKSIKDFKEGDITHKHPETGQDVTTAGIKEWIKSYDTPEKAKQIRRDMNPKIAQQMLNQLSSSEQAQWKEATKALTERAKSVI